MHAWARLVAFPGLWVGARHSFWLPPAAFPFPMPAFRYALPSPLSVFTGVLLAVLFSGCGALNPLHEVEPGPDTAWSRPGRAPNQGVTTATAAPERTSGTSNAASSVRTVSTAGAHSAGAAITALLHDSGKPWLGVPYRYGGDSRSGIDCSAFVRAFMDETFGIRLSRTTATQVREGASVDKRELQPGDLVFFRRRGSRHVGVFLGQNKFIHASSSRGVTVSSLDKGYYRRHYWTARRILTDEDIAGVVPGSRYAPVPLETHNQSAEATRVNRASSRMAW